MQNIIVKFNFTIILVMQLTFAEVIYLAGDDDYTLNDISFSNEFNLSGNATLNIANGSTNVTSSGNSTIRMSGGCLGYAIINGNTDLNIVNGSANVILSSGNSTISMNGGYLGFANINENTELLVEGVSCLSELYQSGGTTTINNGGHLIEGILTSGKLIVGEGGKFSGTFAAYGNNSKLVFENAYSSGGAAVFDGAEIDISGGHYDVFHAYDYSTINYYGGMIEMYIGSSENSIVNFYGVDLSYKGGFVEGIFSDGYQQIRYNGAIPNLINIKKIPEPNANNFMFLYFFFILPAVLKLNKKNP